VRYSQEQSDRPIFVLDQLDQAVWASPALMRIVGDLLRQARDLRIITVIGCRSVDLRDPRIMGWIAGRNTEGNPFDGPERAVSVADLSTNEVKETLAKLHISPDDLDPGILELIRRPLRLRLVVNLAKKGQIHRLRGVRHLVGLMHAWETWVHDDLRRQGQDAQGMSALDQCAEFCQREYATSVPIDALSPDEAQSIQALVELGILIWDDTSKRRLRWSHQNLLDHHLANRWLRSADSGQSIQDLVGPRADQDQRTANRLRLLVPGLCDRTRLRDDITRLSNDNSLRPLSRLGLFRGLAALDESADCLRMRPMVISLLNNPTTWQMALVQICWSRPLWFATLEDWFKVVWQDSTKRNAAISALVSVKTTWGDGVARIITTWREIDPEAITNISFLLYDGHKVDSVLLFSHWLDALDKAPEVHGTHIAWPEFIASHPIRAAQALATLLQKPLRNEWQDPEYFHGLLGPVPAFSEKGREALDHLWIPWSGVSLGQRPSGTIRNSNGPWWSRIIDLIAGAVARALEERQIAWSELVARFPETLRWQDRTLLLRAAKLSHFNDQIQANAAMDWFIRSPAAWFHPANDQPPWMDSAPFISHLASYAAPDKLKILQNTLRQTLDPRFPEDDQRHGATAWFLLNAIPLEQRDQATIDYLAGIESRFANTDQVAYQASWGGVGGIVGSDLSPEQVKVFTDNEWRSAFHNARDNPEIFARQTGHNRVSRRSLDTYAAELRQQSSSNPKRFLSLMESITASDPPAMTEAMICGMLNPPNSTAEDLRLTGAEIISVTTRPLALSQADCSLYIVNCVYQNPSLAWPEELIAALCAWASTPLVPAPNGGHQTEEKLAMSREDLPMATIRALGALAHHNEPLRHRIWARIREAANEHRPDLLASCVVAAYSCRNIDTDAVDGSILDWSSNPLVAAQEDVAELLRWLAQHRQEATSRLLAMSSSEFDWVLGKSGRYRVLLRMDGRITEIDSEFDPARCTLPVKGAMAEVIVAIFRGSPQGWEIATDTWPDWILELTLKLANDSDDNIARQLASVFYVSDGSVWDSRQAVTRLMRDPEFVTRMAKTRSIAIDQHPILGACLIAESLLPWATIIKTIVDQAVSSPMNMHRSGKEVMTVIGRLAEEADQVGDLVNRRLALDAWDALIEAGWSEATDRLASEW
jgi:hypothetical protein